MNLATFQDPAWCRALRLSERIASRRARPYASPHGSLQEDVAERRLRRWRSQAPFDADAYFAQRLTADGITEAEFRASLGEPVEAVHARVAERPAWLADLADAFHHAPSSGQGHEPPDGREAATFLALVEPLLGRWSDHLRAGIEELAGSREDLPFDRATIEQILISHQAERMLTLLGRTLVLELHVARLEGHLQGDSSEERFRSFVERLRRREVALDLFREYPVLARQLVTQLQNGLAASLEFLRHLCADREALRATLCRGNDPGVLVRLDGGVGDRHRGGRAVLIAHFASGFRLVYKPKSLALDVHFQELLTWLNERGDHAPFRTLTVLDRGSHGWVEFVDAHGCRTAEEVRDFYRRQGGYLALLHALAATDFHYENLIAAGEHPVLIDLEALFHPPAEDGSEPGADRQASGAILDSVLRVGLLPQRMLFNAEGEGIDLSGLGGRGGQLAPNATPFWDGAGTDAMRVARKRFPVPEGRHRPSLDGAEVNLQEHVDEIVAGFTSVYRVLGEHRDELLSAAGPLARFAEDETRAILRATQTYAVLQHESCHPDLLRDGLDRDRFFDRLWADVVRRPSLARVVAAERADLHNGDIPMFTTRPNSHDLWDSAGQRVADFFAESGLELVRRRLRQMNESDLGRQVWFIRASVATVFATAEPVRPRPADQPVPAADAGRDRLLAAARAVGDRLEDLAIGTSDEAAWIGLTQFKEREYVLSPLGYDLYGGLPGVALFLTQLGAACGEERYTALARAAVATLLRQLRQVRPAFTAVGGFEGWGGIIYALAHLAALWRRPELLAEAEELVGRLSPLIDQDEQLDIIGGSAGCLASLLCLHHCAPSDRTLAAAIRCGDRLLARAETRGQGVAWVTRSSPVPLTGFSHGAAGVAWALVELSAVTGLQRFRTVAQQAIAYERSLFSQEARNWPDLRDPATLGLAREKGSASFGCAWCHGAPGIGLARLRGLRYFDDAETRAEIDAALRTTLVDGFGGNHSLCHGDLGNVELPLQAGEYLDDPHWHAEAGRLAARIVGSIARDGWLCGLPQRVESPGLMTGLAGIGYGLLRLAEPRRIPSVLVLEPPVGGA
jgi:type 2 lantibiotic biosynthesis protein LanM